MTKTISIEGMTCSHCTGRVEQALRALPGVESVEMSLEEKSARVSGQNLADDALTKVVTDAGYSVTGVQ